ncbi:META domain-containing protein [Flavobacterium sp. IMCC34852]|uniref:META domain-containing protein n=1 Tax=Flavobacterium rivulicola TaxID=2732161 RepID=A0A7Y3VZ25_9FLAO|nr:META domain-containing protein [Flavobacterium sp. IMCC34852]NNT72289.1 META domain-containing protein [Flavobacterium sp. IMCC34852]
MKKNALLLLSLFSILVSACCSTKTNIVKQTDSKTAFYDYAWELEYISGTRIAFDGLYPDRKPNIMFKEAESQFSGNTSCNSYSGKYTKKENSIQFGDAMKTMAFCEGGGEEAFLRMLGKVNRFAFDSEGKLLLLADDIPMMRFKKIAKPN